MSSKTLTMSIRKTELAVVALLLSAGSALASWYGDKYSLFIHYGLYSIPAGVFEGEPVRRGYSEQILTFGIGFSDRYEAYAREFTAEHFDAKAIVALAKASGMRSVVMTSKHHDGFCLFRTKTTDYNAYNGTPAKRDLIGELAEACHEAGMGFGIYFSLIDWHYPYAVPFTSHNADPVTPPHHEYNKAQVRELLTNYGRVDELWFDMGSLTSEQSAELYGMVHELQPDCMVSGRLGNDYADFAVMPDNALPDYRMDMPWQTAASLFPETWGYRSWQERGSVEAKAHEKLTDLIKVVTQGGKYLLNIGPRGDGSVVPWEAEVLRRIGAWLEPISEGVYDTRPADFGHYTTLSMDGTKMYLFVPEEESEVSTAPLRLAPLRVELLGSEEPIRYSRDREGRVVVQDLPQTAAPWRVVRLTFDREVLPNRTGDVPSGHTLTPQNAEKIYAHSSADYYGSYRSIVGYRWWRPRDATWSLTFTDSEVGRAVSLNGEELLLQPTSTTEVTSDPVRPIGSLKYAAARGLFGRFEPEKYTYTSSQNVWTDELRRDTPQKSGIAYEQVLESPRESRLPVRFAYRGGILVYLNGEYIDGDLKREGKGELTLLLPLRKGENTLHVKCYNISDKAGTELQMTPLDRYRLHRMPILPIMSTDACYMLLELKRPLKTPLASAAHLSNVRIIQD